MFRCIILHECLDECLDVLFSNWAMSLISRGGWINEQNDGNTTDQSLPNQTLLQSAFQINVRMCTFLHLAHVSQRNLYGQWHVLYKVCVHCASYNHLQPVYHDPSECSSF